MSERSTDSVGKIDEQVIRKTRRPGGAFFDKNFYVVVLAALSPRS